MSLLTFKHVALERPLRPAVSLGFGICFRVCVFVVFERRSEDD